MAHECKTLNDLVSNSFFHFLFHPKNLTENAVNFVVLSRISERDSTGKCAMRQESIITQDVDEQDVAKIVQ